MKKKDPRLIKNRLEDFNKSLELLHDKKQHESLTEVINEFKSIEKRIKSFTNEFRSTI